MQFPNCRVTKIVVLKALHLPEKDVMSKTDAFVKLKCGSIILKTETRSTKLVEDDETGNSTSVTEWNEVFHVNEDNVDQIVFRVYDKDTFSKNDRIGFCSIKSDAFENGKVYDLLLLDKKTGKNIEGEDGKQSVLKVTIDCFGEKEMREEKKDEKRMKNGDKEVVEMRTDDMSSEQRVKRLEQQNQTLRQELNETGTAIDSESEIGTENTIITTQHRNAFQDMAVDHAPNEKSQLRSCRVTKIVVLKALHLPQRDVMSKTDAYIKVKCGSNIFKTKTVSTKNVENVDGEHEAVSEWNQEFQINEDNVDQITFKVYDQDKFSKDDLIGTCSIKRDEFENDKVYDLFLFDKKTGKGIEGTDAKQSVLKVKIECFGEKKQRKQLQEMKEEKKNEKRMKNGDKDIDEIRTDDMSLEQRVKRLEQQNQALRQELKEMGRACRGFHRRRSNKRSANGREYPSPCGYTPNCSNLSCNYHA